MGKENIFEVIASLESKCNELNDQKKAIDEKISILESKIRNYEDEVRNHSVFNVDLISQALVELINAISGRDFVYGKVTNYHYFTRWITGGREYGNVTDELRIVVASEKYKENYHSEKSDEVEQLVDAGEAISLYVPRWSSPDSIAVYSCPRSEFNFNIEKFGYVKEFIESLIQYCCDNGITESTEKEKVAAAINKCLATFLESHKKEHASKDPRIKLTNKPKGE